MLNGERVSIRSGKLPILVISPHGHDGDDENTSVLTNHIANLIDCYAVINNGWCRAEKVDFMLDKADCNDVVQCHEDVVKEEFLDPIIRYKNKILQTHQQMYIYLIHGMSNKHCKIVGDPDMDIVLGFGAGKPDSLSCEIWQKNYFYHLLKEAGFHPYEGSKGGPMSGWNRSNMNQLFRKWYYDKRINSMQIEIIHEMRKTEDDAKITAEFLADSMKTMLLAKDFITNKINKAY